MNDDYEKPCVTTTNDTVADTATVWLIKQGAVAVNEIFYQADMLPTVSAPRGGGGVE